MCMGKRSYFKIKWYLVRPQNKNLNAYSLRMFPNAS